MVYTFWWNSSLRDITRCMPFIEVCKSYGMKSKQKQLASNSLEECVTPELFEIEQGNSTNGDNFDIQ